MKRIIYFLIAIVWLVNGLICKVLDLVPRHQQIVARFFGDDGSRLMTILIGSSEIVMALWIVSGYKSRLNAIVQMIIVGLMNVLEFVFVPDLLLWGRFNIVFAALFIALVYYNEFVLGRKTNLQPVL